MSSHYRTLGVDPEADPVVIRGAYLALMRRYHPDKGGDEADPVRAQAVTAAWDVLRDPARRAAYDDARQARFQPGGAIAGLGPRVRGGAVGRNLFLLLAAGTLGLGWWALQQPQPGSLAEVAAADGTPATMPRPEPAIRPAESGRAAVGDGTEDELPPLPDVRRKPEAEPVVPSPPLPAAEPVRMPVRAAEARIQPPRSAPTDRPQPAATPQPQPAERTAAAPAITGSPRIDLAPLERHLQLLTDQSLRFGTEAKRARLFATREGFIARLRDCDSDACKRDAYLRRNAEIGEIMRN